MELIQSQSKPNPLEPSRPIHWIVGTERFLRMLEVSVHALRRRQKEVQLELNEPGIAANKERLRELLAELERIARALRGQSARGVAL
jgi:hypothetical protein